VSRVIAFDGNEGVGGLCRLRREIRGEGYDLILDLHDSLRSRYICAGQRGVRRYRKRKLARAVLVRWQRDVYHLFGGSPGVTERYLETVRHLGVSDDGEGPELFPSPGDLAAAGALLRDAVAGWVGVSPSARHETKIWPPERFASAAVSLARNRGFGVVLLGGPDDAARCGAVEAMIRAGSPGVPVVNAAGKLTLLQSAALMDNCAVVLTNDSGLMHVASARKRPLVAVFGSTVRQLGFAPYGRQSIVVERPEVPCRPCTGIGRTRCPQGHFRCMLDISDDQVVAAASTLLRS
jgi:heptosyltransferase-2